MATLMLMRMTPLTEEERSKLPYGCKPVTDSPSVIARADVDLPLSSTFKLAVAMGRAVPDAQFAFHEMTAPGATGLFKSAIPIDDLPSDIAGERLEISEDPFEESEEEPTWWELMQDNDYQGAFDLLTDLTLSVEDRTRLRALFRSPETDHVLAICKWARAFNWRSFVIPLRNLFSHSNARVREEAVRSVGVLAGPSMLPAVHLLRSDKDSKVRAAASKAISNMKG